MSAGSAPPGPRRPASVTVAGVMTIVFCVLTLVALLTAVVRVSATRDQLVDDVRESPGLDALGAEQVVGTMVVVLALLVLWCVVAVVLAVRAMRRSASARTLLVVSASGSAVVSLLAILSLVSAITLLASITVIVLLLGGSAKRWYAVGRQGCGVGISG